MQQNAMAHIYGKYLTVPTLSRLWYAFFILRWLRQDECRINQQLLSRFSTSYVNKIQTRIFEIIHQLLQWYEPSRVDTHQNSFRGASERDSFTISKLENRRLHQSKSCVFRVCSAGTFLVTDLILTVVFQVLKRAHPSHQLCEVE